MIPYLDCRAAQEMLEGFVDGELAVNDQVALESHLRWCRVCAARVEDMQLIGASLRITSCALRAADEADDSLMSVQSEVLTRIKTEHEHSMWAQLRGMCIDMRFFWPAVGASMAVAACLCVAVTVVSLTSDENPDSLAGMIQVLANPGSDRNPMRLDYAMASPPRALDGGALESVPGDEAVFALAAVVTREGRVANYSLLFSERASVRRHDTAVETGDVSSVVNAVNSSRFAPAQGMDGAPVAVNMVWVLARTTVKASAQAAIDPAPVRLAPAPRPVGTTPKPDSPSTSIAPPSSTA
ncbi:MAG TPA: zf-HC2 domain-containing protein [Vicinamibacterales bacterium]